MVHTNVNDTAIRGPYQEVKKGKDGRSTSDQRQQPQQQSASKNSKYGAWGPIYKNKDHFVDMHIC